MFAPLVVTDLLLSVFIIQTIPGHLFYSEYKRQNLTRHESPVAQQDTDCMCELQEGGDNQSDGSP